MGLYEGIKDVAKVVQKADNVELYQKLIDLSAQALDMQEEIIRLKEENSSLKNLNSIRAKVIRHESVAASGDPYITLNDDEQQIRYCARCFEVYGKLIQMDSYNDCPQCIIERVRKV